MADSEAWRISYGWLRGKPGFEEVWHLAFVTYMGNQMNQQAMPDYIAKAAIHRLNEINFIPENFR